MRNLPAERCSPGPGRHQEAARAADEGPECLYISWFGGEPLYGFQAIEDLAPFAQEWARENGVFLKSNMTTNGYLLTPETADKLLSWGINSFKITIDGRPEDHNCSRPTRDGKETFWTIFENLKSLRQRPDDFFDRAADELRPAKPTASEGFPGSGPARVRWRSSLPPQLQRRREVGRQER